MHLILLKKRRLNKAELAFNNGRYKEALKLVKPLANAQNNERAFRANRVCGLALYKQKKYEESIPFLEKTCELNNYRHDWYSLALTFVYADKLEQAEKAFQNIYRTNVQPGYMYAVPVPGLLFQYLRALIQKQFEDVAKIRANELKQMYIGVGNDTTKQVQRGLPSYALFLKEVKALLDPEKFKAWESEFKP